MNHLPSEQRGGTINLLPMGGFVRDHVVSAGRIVQTLRANGIRTNFEGRDMLVIPAQQLEMVEKLLSAALSEDGTSI